ncbi:YraN family protein [uncultured Tenacibaculum sp.]|uniref:YraN family protein n=1 Tax=uncultured Tenacibaculum sp. TaxID=174713 RepID=UPI00260A7EB3|nr:YraN family protein [uncultured Tenacibaculum sp.]
MAEHNELGKKGEKIAVDYLLEKGFQIIERNYRFQKAEVDIIAKKDDLLIAIEVKTRSSIEFGDPQDFVSPKKIKLLVSAIDHYVIEKNLDVEVRFDIIAIVIKNNKENLEHIEDAFLHF